MDLTYGDQLTLIKKFMFLEDSLKNLPMFLG